jgi:lactoylglutathione lyase
MAFLATGALMSAMRVRSVKSPVEFLTESNFPKCAIFSEPMNLYETHLPVLNTEASKAFYIQIVGLRFAYRDPARDIVFLWIGENRVSMLGLWGPHTAFGSPLHKSHLAIAVSLPELLAAGKRLNNLGVPTHDFANAETTEPSVIGWMPSAQLYFRDPNGHLLEFITLLDEEPDANFIGPFAEWQKRTAPAKSADV